MSETILIEGPMHPDMFDGETPVMTPVKVDKLPILYAVDVTVNLDETYIICAADNGEAEYLGEEAFMQEHHVPCADSLTTMIRIIDSDHPNYRKLLNAHIYKYLDNHRVEEAA